MTARTNSLPGRPAAIAIALFVSTLGGCVSLDPEPDRTREYTLSAPARASSFAAVAGEESPTVGVRVVSVASHLHRWPIAVRVSEHEIRYDENQRWAERLDGAVERTVIAAVQQRLGSRITVTTAAAMRRPGPDVMIEIDVLHCEGRQSGTPAAVVVADWRIIAAKSARRAPAASGRFVAEKPEWTAGNFEQLTQLLAAGFEDLAAAVAEPAAKIAGEAALASVIKP